METKDGLIRCPHCGSEVCYEQHIGDVTTAMCLSCGFTTTSQMQEGSEAEQAVFSKNPKLYKGLRFVDPATKLVWYPAVLAVPEKGMVYINGSTEENWQWTATPVRKLTRKEQRLKKYQGQKYVADMKSSKFFGKDGFLEAATSLGMFDAS